MSDYEIDWGTEDGLHVDHGGGVDHVFGDHQFDQHDQHDQHEPYETDGPEDITGVFEIDGGVEDEPLEGVDDDVDELPDWQLDPAFTDGHYDLIGADPHEGDLWSQLMTDMHEEINPYAAN